MIFIECTGLPEARPEGLIQRFAHLEQGLVKGLDRGRAKEMNKKKKRFRGKTEQKLKEIEESE